MKNIRTSTGIGLRAHASGSSMMTDFAIGEKAATPVFSGSLQAPVVGNPSYHELWSMSGD
jgi:hypothetical protein